MIRSISVIFTISTSRRYCVSSQTFSPPPGVPRCMAARISYFSLYRAAGFSSIPLLRHQHINPVRRSNSLTHPQDQSGVLQLPQGPLAGLRTAPRRHGQLHNGKLAGFSFGYGKGAACLPRLGGWCLFFRFWLDKVSRGEELTDVGLFALLFSARVYFGDLVQAWKYSQYLQYISSALDRKTKPAHGTYPGSKHCFDIAFSSAVNK